MKIIKLLLISLLCLASAVMANEHKNSILSTDEQLLLECVRDNKLSEAEELLKKGVNPNIPDSEDAEPLLSYAIENNNFDMVKLLVKYGADIHLLGEANETLLMLAAARGNVDILRFLLEKKPDLNAVDLHGLNALMYAELTDQKKAADLLIKYGASPMDQSQINIVNAVKEFGEESKMIIQSCVCLATKLNQISDLLKRINQSDFFPYYLKQTILNEFEEALM